MEDDNLYMIDDVTFDRADTERKIFGDSREELQSKIEINMNLPEDK